MTAAAIVTMPSALDTEPIRSIPHFTVEAGGRPKGKEAVMTPPKNARKTCSKGHTYTKSSDCPTCPLCEAERAPGSGFLSTVGAPARRALEREGITTLPALSAYSEHEILQLHGIGPSAIPKLRRALEAGGLGFRDE